jgi:hypothetical protein
MQGLRPADHHQQQHHPACCPGAFGCMLMCCCCVAVSLLAVRPVVWERGASSRSTGGTSVGQVRCSLSAAGGEWSKATEHAAYSCRAQDRDRLRLRASSAVSAAKATAAATAMGGQAAAFLRHIQQAVTGLQAMLLCYLWCCCNEAVVPADHPFLA